REEIIAPLGRRLSPNNFQAAADRVASLAGAEFALPAEALFLDAGRFGLCAHVCRVAGAVGFAKCVAAGNQRDGFFVIHRHSAEGFADIPGRRDGIRLAVRPFRIYVDQAHLHGAEGFLKLAVAGVALVAQPLAFRAPVDFFGLPDVRAATAKTECLEAHGLQSDVSCKNYQVGPGDLAAVLLLDRPQQAASLVQVHVVRPAVQGSESLLAGAGAAPPVVYAVRARAVPRHANKQPAVVPEVGRPPILRVGHHGIQVLDHGIQVKSLELLGVIELFAHRIRKRGMLVENLNVELVRPPLPVCVCGSSREWALRFSCHVLSNRLSILRVSWTRNDPTMKTNTTNWPVSHCGGTRPSQGPYYASPSYCSNIYFGYNE